MFNHLTIKNFAIVKDLDIDFRNGMTAITGETGAGKSIAIDALGGQKDLAGAPAILHALAVGLMG